MIGIDKGLSLVREVSEKPMNKMSLSAKAFIGLVIILGSAALANGLAHWRIDAWEQFAALLAVAVAASRLKVNLPGVNGCMSVNLIFFLMAAAQLSLGEAVVIACVASLVQSLWASSKRMKAVQVAFNAATMISAVALAAMVFQWLSNRGEGLPLALTAAGAAFFLANTVPVAIVLWVAEEQKPLRTWLALGCLTFPYYLLSTGMAIAACTAAKHLGWQIPLMLFPLVYLTYRSYQVYFSAASKET